MNIKNLLISLLSLKNEFVQKEKLNNNGKVDYLQQNKNMFIRHQLNKRIESFLSISVKLDLLYRTHYKPKELMLVEKNCKDKN